MEETGRLFPSVGGPDRLSLVGGISRCACPGWCWVCSLPGVFPPVQPLPLPPASAPWGHFPFPTLQPLLSLDATVIFFFFQLSSYCSEYWCFFVIKKALKTPLFLLNILSTRRSKGCAPVPPCTFPSSGVLHLGQLRGNAGGGEGG